MISLQSFMEKYYQTIAITDVEKLRNKTILITGASGLIGSNLTAYLDYINNKRHLNMRIKAIIRSKVETWFAKSPQISYLTTDLSSQKIPVSLGIDYIIHCATYTQPKKFLAFPVETVKLNIEVLFKLLELAKKNSATMLYPSTAEIYGMVEKKDQPTTEDYFGSVNTLSDRSIYVESKRLAETICYSRRNEIAIKLARILISYGPGVKYSDQRVISEFIKRAQTEHEITMMDDGAATRTFCFVTDTIEMLLNILLTGNQLVYNVSGDETTTIKVLAQRIATINGVQFSGVFKKQIITGTPRAVIVSNDRYCTEFKKKKFVSLDEGLLVTSKWFENISTV